MTKKNTVFKLAGLLLVLVLVTSCFVGGTFAKYTTAATGSDSARVAKFGVAVTANGETFKTAYAKDDNTATITGNSVVSSDDDKLVAPGTKGNMVSMTLSGKPEVAVKVTYKADVSITGNWVKNDSNDFYCPLTVKVNDTEIKGTEQTSANAFETAIKNAIDGYSKEYDANTDLSGEGEDSVKVSWSWAFSTDEEGDTADTYLGDKAATDVSKAGKISLGITTTVTQID